MIVIVQAQKEIHDHTYTKTLKPYDLKLTLSLIGLYYIKQLLKKW